MPSRRSVLRNAIVLATGSALIGTATATNAESDPHVPYDAGALADGGTTLSARVDPRAVELAPLPGTVSARLRSLADRLDLLSVADLGQATGSLAISGSQILGGGAVVEGSFEPHTVVRDLRGSVSKIEDRTANDQGIDYYQIEAKPYVLGAGRQNLVVGFGPDDESPLSHAKAVGSARQSTETTKRLQSIAASIDGGSWATATLGPSTRSTALHRLPEGANGLTSILREAKGFGVGIDVAADQSKVTYGIDLDWGSVDGSNYWELLTRSTEQTDGFTLEAVNRDGRTLVLGGSVPTEQLWSVHEDLLAIDLPD